MDSNSQSGFEFQFSVSNLSSYNLAQNWYLFKEFWRKDANT